MPRLDLSGINLNDFTKKRVKRELHIQQPTIQVSTRPVRVFPCKPIVLCLFTMGIVAFFITRQRSEKVVANFKKGGQLRRMIRMNCQSRNGITYCSTTQTNGDYVVSVGNCNNVYEFNGIPFTDIFVDDFGNYRVPSSADSMLRGKESCDSIVATVDTAKKSYDSYSTQSNSMGQILKVVWITKSCYKDFTVKINGELIFEHTPV